MRATTFIEFIFAFQSPPFYSEGFFKIAEFACFGARCQFRPIYSLKVQNTKLPNFPQLTARSHAGKKLQPNMRFHSSTLFLLAVLGLT
jgi:hypothetical protein